MKRAKVCALLCVAAMSVNPVLPVMAAESTVENTEASETTVNEETGNEQEKTNETESVAPVEDNTQTTEQEETEQQNPVVEGSNTQDAAIPQEGLYTDENGDTYYYENGKKVCNEIRKIRGEGGLLYGHYFQDDGKLLKDAETWVYINDEEYGYVKADEVGYLYSGWLTTDWGDVKYYGENYIQYQRKILDKDGVLYYFDDNGDLVTDDTVIIDGVQYTANSDGVLTKETVESTKWVLAN